MVTCVAIGIKRLGSHETLPTTDYHIQMQILSGTMTWFVVFFLIFLDLATGWLCIQMIFLFIYLFLPLNCI